MSEHATHNEAVYDETSARQRLAAELPCWELTNNCLRRVYKTFGWKGTLMVANTIGHLAEAAFHHPDLALSYKSVTVELTTHSAGGITDKDFTLAAKCEQVVMWRPGLEGGALEGTPEDPRYRYIDYD